MSDDFIRVRKETLLQLVQSTLEAKRMATSLKTFADAVIPLMSDPKAMEEVRAAAARAAHELGQLYERNARKAYGID